MLEVFQETGLLDVSFLKTTAYIGLLSFSLHLYIFKHVYYTIISIESLVSTWWDMNNLSNSDLPDLYSPKRKTDGSNMNLRLLIDQPCHACYMYLWLSLVCTEQMHF